jgi:large subunit ribosomal protein L10
MPKTKTQKEDLVLKYREVIKKSNSMIFSEPHSIKVNEINELRKSIGDDGGAVWIVKNTLFERALKDEGIDMPAENREGMNLVFFSFTDPAAVAKVAFEISKEEKVGLKNSLLSGSEISVDQVKHLAELPSLDELRAKVLGTMLAPISAFARVLNGNTNSMLNLLNNLSQKG